MMDGGDGDDGDDDRTFHVKMCCRRCEQKTSQERTVNHTTKKQATGSSLHREKQKRSVWTRLKNEAKENNVLSRTTATKKKKAL